MSKELTEQYIDGTLPCGFYYFTNGKDVHPVEHHQVKGITAVMGVSVVDKMPTYDQFVGLTEKANLFPQLVKKVEELECQLKEANEALKEFCSDCLLPKCNGCDKDCAGWKAKEYLKKWGVE